MAAIHRSLTLLSMLTIAVGCVGCASSGDGKTPKPVEVSLAEFSRPADSSATAGTSSVESGAVDAGTGDSTAGSGNATAIPLEAGDRPADAAGIDAAGIDSATADGTGPGGPDQDDSLASGSDSDPAADSGTGQWTELEMVPGVEVTPGEEFVIDSLVGQVNGRPIYAQEFLEPIEDQLRVLSENAPTSRTFIMEARQIIQSRLRQVVLEELFIAEAEAGLNEMQQQGLLAWLRDFREGLISSKGGSRTATEEILQDEEGVTVEEYIGNKKDETLISHLFQERIESRLIVSWRDVEREYKRRYREFNPPATVLLSRIRLRNATQAEQIEIVKTRLAEGVPFEAVAESVGITDGGQWEQLELPPGGLAEVELNEQIRKQIAGLEVGQTSEAFAIGRSTWWLHVAEIDQPEQRTLYDPELQESLANQIMSRRRSEEQRSFIDSLMEGGIYDEINEMADRLLVIVVRRYTL